MGKESLPLETYRGEKTSPLQTYELSDQLFDNYYHYHHYHAGRDDVTE
ncbi:MAG: hypothetical protein VKL59_04680 [Nostocaceae cyanobacterium]|nr:hypothetical protein [Nostocaceae cyanobacterium]